MTEKRFKFYSDDYIIGITDTATGEKLNHFATIDLLNEQQTTISQLEKEKQYWKSKAMTLLMQVRRLTPRMTDKEVIEFNKELEENE